MFNIPLNIIVQIIFETIQVNQLFGLAMTVGESERQVDTGIRGSFRCLQRPEEVLAEWQDELIVGFFCFCSVALKMEVCGFIFFLIGVKEIGLLLET